MKKIVVIVLLLFVVPSALARAPTEVVTFTMDELLGMDKKVRDIILSQAEIQKKDRPPEITTEPTTIQKSLPPPENAEVTLQDQVSIVIDAINALFVKLSVTLNAFIMSPAGFLASLGIAHKIGGLSSLWRSGASILRGLGIRK